MASKKDVLGLRLAAIACAAIFAVLFGFTTQAIAVTNNETGSGETIVLGDTTIIALTTESEACTTATQLATALNAGSIEGPATGDDVTGIVTVTDVCAGVDGAGLGLIRITPSEALSGIVFDGPDAEIVMGADANNMLAFGADASGDAPFTISGAGTVTGLSAQTPPIALVSLGGPGATLVLEAGVTVQNTVGGFPLIIQNGACEVREGATVSFDNANRGIQVGYDENPDEAQIGSLTVEGTVRNVGGMAIIVCDGTCTIEDRGLVECNTSGGYYGVQVGDPDGARPDDDAALTLVGGTIRDLAGDSVDHPTVMSLGSEAGGKASLTMTGGEVAGGNGEWATVNLGALTPNEGKCLPATLAMTGGTVANVNGGNAIDVTCGSAATIGGEVAIQGDVSVSETVETVTFDGGTITGKLINEGPALVEWFGGEITGGTEGTILTMPTPDNSAVVYRLYNPYHDGAHLLTADEGEVVGLEKLGWVSEGKRFTEYANPTTGSAAVYRLYNPNNGDHFFTASNDEASSLESVGWTREGVAWYAPARTTIPAYRLYNPHQTEFGGLGNHLWTILESERDDLINLGWQSEGVGWCTFPL